MIELHTVGLKIRAKELSVRAGFAFSEKVPYLLGRMDVLEHVDIPTRAYRLIREWWKLHRAELEGQMLAWPNDADIAPETLYYNGHPPWVTDEMEQDISAQRGESPAQDENPFLSG